MSETMVERVAKAVGKACPFVLQEHSAKIMARAAIEALRQPTEAMVDSCGNGEAAKWGRGCWANYLVAALATPGEG